MVVPPDNHVHSEWSYDTTDQASMTGACERALDVGVPAIAFTEHLDFTRWSAGDPGMTAGLEPRHRSRIAPLNITGYLAAIEECRQRFPGLRILSGVETGEPHLFAASAGAVVGRHQFDPQRRVLLKEAAQPRHQFPGDERRRCGDAHQAAPARQCNAAAIQRDVGEADAADAFACQH